MDWNGTSRFDDDVSMVCLEFQSTAVVSQGMEKEAIALNDQKIVQQSYFDENGGDYLPH